MKVNAVWGAVAALSIACSSGAALAQSDKDVRAEEAGRGHTGVIPLDRARAREEQRAPDRRPPPQARVQPPQPQQPRIDNRAPSYGDRDAGRRYESRPPVYVNRGDGRYDGRAPVYVERDNPRYDGRGEWRQGRYGERYDRDGRRWGAGPEHNFYRGGRLPPEYRRSYYVVDDWRGHRLSAPPGGYQWVQTGSDYVLVAIATGIIASIILSQ